MKLSRCLAALLLVCFSTGFTASQSHENYSALITIDGKQTHTYTVQFSQNGDTTKRVTSYFDGSKRLVRQETTKFRANTLTLFANKIEDFRTGEYLWQTASGNRFYAQRRERTGSENEQKSITADNAIVTTLVSERVAMSMEALDRGETVTFTLALPLRGIVTDMNLVKISSEIVGGVACSTIKLEPSNVIFRLMMGEPSLFTFERAKPHRFMQYKGILGLPTPEGKQQSGTVAIKY